VREESAREAGDRTEEEKRGTVALSISVSSWVIAELIDCVTTTMGCAGSASATSGELMALMWGSFHIVISDK
jgi:hypothetical protein